MDRLQFDKKQEEQLIKETMRSSIDMGKAIRIFLAQRLRYPFIKGKVGELEPNVFFGYSDHPLDINATAQTIPFTFLGKNKGRVASCVLQAGPVTRQGNSFKFQTKGYNIINIRNMKNMACHEYLVNNNTRFQPLTLQIDFLRQDAYRLRLVPGADLPANQTLMVQKDITAPDLEVEFFEDEEKYTLATQKLTLHVYKMRFRIEIFDAQGQLITESGSQTKNEFASALDAYPLGFIRDRHSRRTYGVDSFILYPGEAVYGLGEHFRPVNRVGQTIGLWNFEGQGNTSGRTYKNIPFFMSTQGYGVFVNESRPVTFWIGSRELCRNQFAVEGELIDYYFFYGPSFKTILDTYTELTGKPALPPRWSFGTWVSSIR
jgi:alpha-glucosidase (family GH31 glycosyl hydrolase)